MQDVERSGGAPVDTQLLFGVLAVQYTNITAQDLYQAGTAWLAEPGASLANQLESTGKLSKPNREFVDGLVLRMLDLHQGDLQASLASIGGSEVVEQSFGVGFESEGEGSVLGSIGGSEAPEPNAEEESSDVEEPRPSDRSILPADVAVEERYEKRGEKGRGGVGRVLKVYDKQIGREVAFKEVLAKHLPDQSEMSEGRSSGQSSTYMKRFLREARVTGQLEHPNIVPVYELGKQANGALYYTMQLVRGRTLKDEIKKAEGLGERLGLLSHFANVCHAVAYAHSRGVVHRDIKPENIMVGEFGETYLLDWGLAKVHGQDDLRGDYIEEVVKMMVREDPEKTLAGHALGTPAYMSPEQAHGDIEQVDERSDIWSLGVVLYELLTGQTPFQGDSPYEIIGKVMREPVRPVRELCSEAPAELATVAEKALMRSPDERYLNARELELEIAAYSRGGRVESHVYSSRELVSRFIRQNRGAVAVAAVGLALMVLVAFGGHLKTLEERDAALQAQAQTRVRLAQALTERARSAQLERNWTRSEAFAAAALQIHERPDARGVLAELDGTWRPELHWANPVGTGCMDIGFSPRGDAVACASYLTVWVWSLTDGALLHQLNPTNAWLATASYSPDGRFLAAGAGNGTIFVWDTHGYYQVRALEGHVGQVWAVRWSADSKRLVSGGQDRTVRIWQLADGKQLHVVRDHTGPVKGVELIAGGQAVASSSADGTMRIAPLANPGVSKILLESDYPLGSLSLSEDGVWLAVAGGDRIVRSWNTVSGRRGPDLKGHRRAVTSMRFVSGTHQLLTGSDDGIVRLWRVETGELHGGFSAHAQGLHSVNGWDDSTTGRSYLVSGGKDNRVRLWSVRADSRDESRLRHQNPIEAVLFSPDSERLITGDDHGDVRIWEVSSGALIRKLDAHQRGATRALGVSDDNQWLATGGDDTMVRVWSMADASLKYTLEGHVHPVRAVAFSADGKHLASGADDRTIRIWNLETGKLVTSWTAHQGLLTALAFRPHTHELVSASWDKTVRLWDMNTFKEVGRATSKKASPVQLQFSDDGHKLWFGDEAGRIHLWNVEAGSSTELTRAAHGQAVHLAIAREGRYVAYGGQGAQVELKSLAGKKLLAELSGERDRATHMVLSPDQSRLAIVNDGLVVSMVGMNFLWESAEDLVASARKNYGVFVEGIDLSFTD